MARTLLEPRPALAPFPSCNSAYLTLCRCTHHQLTCPPPQVFYSQPSAECTVPLFPVLCFLCGPLLLPPKVNPYLWVPPEQAIIFLLSGPQCPSTEWTFPFSKESQVHWCPFRVKHTCSLLMPSLAPDFIGLSSHLHEVLHLILKLSKEAGVL
jgi:hypothetical protein